MGFSVIFIVIFAVSQATAIGDLKNGNRQSDNQVTRPTAMESSSLKSMQESLRAAHMKLQANQIEGSGIRDQVQLNQPQIQSQFHSQNLQSTSTPLNQDSTRDQSMYQTQDNSRDQSLYQSRDNSRDQSLFQSQDSSRDQSLFQSQRDSFPTTTISSVTSKNGETNAELSFQQQMNQESRRNSENQQIYNSNHQSLNQQQFYNDKQQASDEQQFYNSRHQSPVQQQLFNSRQQIPTQQQLFPVRQQTPSQQQFYNNRHQTVSQQQQIYNPRDQSSVQQQQLFNAGQQSHEQQKIFSNVQTMDINGQRINLNDQRINLNDQRINLNHQIQGVSVHQSQIRSERPLILSQDALTQIQSKGVSKGVQLSAFDIREHGLVLPRGSSVRSASVIVSGLKNLPMLPAMVYNGGPVPVAHAIAYGRDGYYKGTASLSQQLQTPYVRYVYSHIL